MRQPRIFARSVLIAFLLIGLLAAPLALTAALGDQAPAQQQVTAADTLISPPEETPPSVRDIAANVSGGRAAPLLAGPDDVVISEWRSRGPGTGQSGTGAATDEFIELFNPQGSPVSIGNWSLWMDDCSGTHTQLYVVADPTTLGSGVHYLVAGTNYTGDAASDGQFIGSPNILDNGGIALFDGPNDTDNLIDQVGTCEGAFHEGTPLEPLTGKIDQSYSRDNFGGGCLDNDQNNQDFTYRSPSDPQNQADGSTPCSSPTATPTNTPPPTSTATPTLTCDQRPTPSSFSYTSIDINEVGWAGTVANSGDEWIELYNATGCPINLTGWTLKASRSGQTTPHMNLKFPKNMEIAPGYFVIAKNNKVFSANVTIDWVNSNLDLSDSGEILQLVDQRGFTVDHANLAYGYVPAWPAGSASSHASMERVRLTYDSASNWATYAGPMATRNYPVPRDRNGNVVPGTPGHKNWAFTVTLTPTVTRTPYRFRTSTPRPPTPYAHLVINEFLPRAGTDWNHDGAIDVGDEFIELKNNGPIDVDLKGWKLDDEANVGSLPFTLPSLKLKTGERAVFYGSQTKILLDDSGDTVRVLNPSGILLDARTYGPVTLPDQTHCRLPDGIYWRFPCFPTPGLENSLSGTAPQPPPSIGYSPPPCFLPDTAPQPFLDAECGGYGADIFNPALWDNQAGNNEFPVQDAYYKWRSTVR